MSRFGLLSKLRVSDIGVNIILLLYELMDWNKFSRRGVFRIVLLVHVV